jgi:hypothetical protein
MAHQATSNKSRAHYFTYIDCKCTGWQGDQPMLNLLMCWCWAGGRLNAKAMIHVVVSVCVLYWTNAILECFYHFWRLPTGEPFLSLGFES